MKAMWVRLALAIIGAQVLARGIVLLLAVGDVLLVGRGVTDAYIDWAQIEMEDGLPADALRTMSLARQVSAGLEYIVAKTYSGTLVVYFLTAATGGLVAIAAARRLSAPMGEIAGKAAAYRPGHPPAPIHPRGPSEVAETIAAFNRMVTAMEESQAHSREMTAAIAHDLRAPLAALSLHLRAIRDGLYPPDEIDFEGLSDQVEHLTMLVHDLHTLSLVDGQRLKFNAERVNLSSRFIPALIPVVRRFAAQKNIVFDAMLPEQLPEVCIDGDRLIQALVNVLHNAYRHTPQGGRVTFALMEADREVMIHISDTGEGIAPEDLPLLFDRYYSGGEGRAQGDKSGLGLSLARALIEGQGGRITAASEGPGKGAVFTISLPAAGLIQPEAITPAAT
ncbi:MAG: HAMP domain-containing histidine kinase [Anaerolineae bacterium]|nr:HAMP domain-containing histidine kinase [Anaerolineae bacterium]